MRTSSGRRCRGAGLRLLGSWVALLPLVIPLTGLLLHREHLCGLSVVRLCVLPQFPVEDG
jgi:hypothetical protein